MQNVNESIMPGAEPFLYKAGDETGCLLIHGFGGTPYCMKPLGKHLWEKGITTMGVRLKGHGSTPSDMFDCRYQDWVESAEAGLYQLKKICSKVFVAGLSMGGGITLHLAANHPGEIEGIIPICAPTIIEGWRSRLIPFSSLIKRITPYLPMVGSAINDPNAEEVNYKWVPTKSLIELISLINIVRNGVPLIKQPALVIASRLDPVVQEQSARYIMEHIGSTEKDIAWVENSLHVVTLDYDKETVFNLIDKFIFNQSCNNEKSA